MSYTWKEEYSVGIKEIDEQHKHFICILNKFLNRHKEHLTYNEVAILTDELLNYALYHFSEEEKYLKKCKCSLCSKHINSHKDYKDNLQNYRIEIMNNKNNNELFNEIEEYIKEYMVKHIIKGHETHMTSCLEKFRTK